MLSTIALVTAIGATDLPDAQGWIMFHTIFPAKSKVLANEFRTIVESGEHDGGDPQQITFVVCFIFTANCAIEVAQMTASCHNKCQAKYCPAGNSSNCPDPNGDFVCADCCDDQGLIDSIQCWTCGTTGPNVDNYNARQALPVAPPPPPPPGPDPTPVPISPWDPPE